MHLPEAFVMRIHFTTKVPFCNIEPDLANGTTAATLVNIKHLPENSEANSAGKGSHGLISLDLFEVPQVWMQQADTLL